VDTIRCALLDPESLKQGEDHFQFQHIDGSPMSPNELVDIGQNPWGHKYPASKTNFLWKLENYSPDIQNQYWQRRCFATMFRTVGLIIPRRYRSVRQNTDMADFNIRFVDDIDVFGGKLSVLAHAYLFHPNNPPGINGLMEFNDSPESKHMFTPFGDTLEAYLVDNINYSKGDKRPDGTLKMLGTQPLLGIGMHELKHNKGYRHNLLESDSLMYPYVKRGYSSDGTINKGAFTWTESDMNRWEEGYGRRRFAWLHHMRARRLRGRRVNGIPYLVAT